MDHVQPVLQLCSLPRQGYRGLLSLRDLMSERRDLLLEWPGHGRAGRQVREGLLVDRCMAPQGRVRRLKCSQVQLDRG